MWCRGFVAEVAGLADRGLRQGRTASRALGYRQVLEFLDGMITEDREPELRPYGPRAGSPAARTTLVPPRPADHVASARPTGPERRRSGVAGGVAGRGRMTGVRGVVVCQGTWHRERLRSPRRPGEHASRAGPDQVARICDRRAGIGGNGLLRAVLAKHIEGWDGDGQLWFMDYSNADGSIAEMCGDGVRVFVRYLVEEGLAYGPVVSVATRAGVREAEMLPDGRIRVAMGPVVVYRIRCRSLRRTGRPIPRGPLTSAIRTP